MRSIKIIKKKQLCDLYIYIDVFTFYKTECWYSSYRITSAYL